MDKSSREDDFDPFNPKSKDDKIQKNKNDNDNINILYITGALIIVLIVIWIIVVIMTKNDNIEILNEMAKPNNQTKLASDKKI